MVLTFDLTLGRLMVTVIENNLQICEVEHFRKNTIYIPLEIPQNGNDYSILSTNILKYTSKPAQNYAEIVLPFE